MAKKSFTDETRELLNASDETLQEISDGSGLGYHWVNKFACGVIKNPSAERLITLRAYLTAKPPTRSRAERVSA